MRKTRRLHLKGHSLPLAKPFDIYKSWRNAMSYNIQHLIFFLSIYLSSETIQQFRYKEI
jgi:hypothetical protein